MNTLQPIQLKSMPRRKGVDVKAFRSSDDLGFTEKGFTVSTMDISYHIYTHDYTIYIYTHTYIANMYTCIYLSICLSVCLPIYLFNYLPTCIMHFTRFPLMTRTFPGVRTNTWGCNTPIVPSIQDVAKTCLDSRIFLVKTSSTFLCGQCWLKRLCFVSSCPTWIPRTFSASPEERDGFGGRDQTSIPQSWIIS